jgi:hypothetical protein
MTVYPSIWDVSAVFDRDISIRVKAGGNAIHRLHAAQAIDSTPPPSKLQVTVSKVSRPSAYHAPNNDPHPCQRLPPLRASERHHSGVVRHDPRASLRGLSPLWRLHTRYPSVPIGRSPAPINLFQNIPVLSGSLAATQPRNPASSQPRNIPQSLIGSLPPHHIAPHHIARPRPRPTLFSLIIRA